VSGTVGTALAGDHGTLTLNANGSYSYVVNQADSAVQGLRTATDTLTDTFSYTVTDTAGATSTTTLTVTIHGANDAPVAVVDTADATEAGGVGNGTAGVDPTGNVLTNDTDVDSGDTKTVSAVTHGAVSGTVGTALAGDHGTLTLNANGSYSYVVNQADSAVQGLRTATDTLTDTFSYTVTDTAGATSTTTLTVTIHGANDAPVAVVDTADATEAGGVGNGTAGVAPTGNVLTNDTDVDGGDTKTVSAVTHGAVSGTVGTALAGDHGTLTLNANGSYSYVVNQADSAVQGLRTATDTLTDTFSYTVTDTAGATSTTTLTVTIHGANDAPVAVVDTADATEAGGVGNGTAGVDPTGNVLTNDTDVDSGDQKTVSAVTHGAVSGTVGTALAGDHGTLTLNANGSYSYVVNQADSAVQGLRTATDTLTDTFSYTVTDTAGATSTTTLT